MFRYTGYIGGYIAWILEGLLIGALLGSVDGIMLGSNEWTELGFWYGKLFGTTSVDGLSLEPMNELKWDSGMGECLTQHLGLWKDSYLVNKIEQS